MLAATCYRFSQWQVGDFAALKWHSPAELAPWVECLRAAGVDLLHVSTRVATDIAFPDHGAGTLAGWARRLSGLPTIAVGGVSLRRDGEGSEAPLVVEDPGPAMALLASGEADMLAVGRMLIANLSWTHVVRDGDWRDLKPYDHGQLATLD